MREKEVLQLHTVQYAILETGGNLSVFLFPGNRPATAKEAGIQAKKKLLPVTVVSDGGVYTVTHGFFSNFSATLSCMSNIGPGFEAVGPYLSFAGYSYLSKVLLALTMLLGRLEILPVLILFHPKTWRRV